MAAGAFAAQPSAGGRGGNRHRRSGRRRSGQACRYRLVGLGRAPRGRVACCRAAQALSRRSRVGATQDRARGLARACYALISRRRRDCSAIILCALAGCRVARAAQLARPAALKLRLAPPARSRQLSCDARVRRRSRGVAASRCCSRSATLSGRRIHVHLRCDRVLARVAGRGGRRRAGESGRVARALDAVAPSAVADRAVPSTNARPALRAHVTLARKVAQAPVLQAMSPVRVAGNRTSV